MDILGWHSSSRTELDEEASESGGFLSPAVRRYQSGSSGKVLEAMRLAPYVAAIAAPFGEVEKRSFQVRACILDEGCRWAEDEYEFGNRDYFAAVRQGGELRRKAIPSPW